MANGNVSRAWSSLTAGLLVVAMSVFGAIGGATVATRVLTTTGMGWDQLADMLGGMMLGGAAGLVAGVLAVWLLPRMRRCCRDGGLHRLCASDAAERSPPRRR